MEGVKLLQDEIKSREKELLKVSNAKEQILKELDKRKKEIKELQKENAKLKKIILHKNESDKYLYQLILKKGE